jgi:hypothetical protein
VLSSAISQTQTQWDFLAVFTSAIRRYGAPEALVTDGGGQSTQQLPCSFMTCWEFAKNALTLENPGKIMCAASAFIGIPAQCRRGREHILSYAETLFSIQRRLADYAFSNARIWLEIQQAHQTWWKNYNVEDHYAHHERQDGRHSPSAVLRGMSGRFIPEEVLSRALYATQFTR